jgi:hypothetical protein
MPRRPRVLIEGALYHVYNRCTTDSLEVRAYLAILRHLAKAARSPRGPPAVIVLSTAS